MRHAPVTKQCPTLFAEWCRAGVGRKGGGGSVPGVFGGVLPINAPTKPQHSLITAFTGTLIHVDPHQRDPSRPTQTLLNTRALPLQDKLSV